MSQMKTREYVQFVHVSRRFNPVTTVFTCREDGETVTVNFGLSLCHKGDRFVREKGREIASGRLAKRPSTFSYTRNPAINFSAQLSQEVRDHVRSIGFPLSFMASGKSMELVKHRNSQPSDDAECDGTQSGEDISYNNAMSMSAEDLIRLNRTFDIRDIGQTSDALLSSFNSLIQGWLPKK